MYYILDQIKRIKVGDRCKKISYDVPIYEIFSAELCAEIFDFFFCILLRFELKLNFVFF